MRLFVACLKKLSFGFGSGVWSLGRENEEEQLTDAEEQKGEQCDGVAAEFPAQRAGRGALLCRLHGGVLCCWVRCWIAGSYDALPKLAACHYCEAQTRLSVGGLQLDRRRFPTVCPAMYRLYDAATRM